MYEAYSNSTLVLGMGLHIGGKLTLYGWQLHEFENEYLPTMIDCNAPYNREYCKCKDWA